VTGQAHEPKPDYHDSVPFRSPNDSRQHFSDHAAEFVGIVTEADYILLAEAFMNGPKSASTLECNRPQGGRARYDSVTQEYGSVRADGTIATYFIPNPAIHGLPSNLDYYLLHCK
jgi:filamentous hemagglutinin